MLGYFPHSRCVGGRVRPRACCFFLIKVSTYSQLKNSLLLFSVTLASYYLKASPLCYSQLYHLSFPNTAIIKSSPAPSLSLWLFLLRLFESSSYLWILGCAIRPYGTLGIDILILFLLKPSSTVCVNAWCSNSSRLKTNLSCYHQMHFLFPGLKIEASEILQDRKSVV